MKTLLEYLAGDFKVNRFVAILVLAIYVAVIVSLTKGT